MEKPSITCTQLTIICAKYYGANNAFCRNYIFWWQRTQTHVKNFFMSFRNSPSPICSCEKIWSTISQVNPHTHTLQPKILSLNELTRSQDVALLKKNKSIWWEADGRLKKMGENLWLMEKNNYTGYLSAFYTCPEASNSLQPCGL